jgi:thiol:disulfide interchange protein DsbD
LPLELYLKNQGNFNLEGKAKESKTKTAYNDIFEVNETFFKVSQIQQIVHVTNPKVSTIKLS